ncbi:MAG: hypothetical protein IJ861_01915 [Clostridia bacterium]|nr:hypothetical protein [Clostridia bacterium]
MDIQSTTKSPEVQKTIVMLRELSADEKLHQEVYYREKRLHDEASALKGAMREGIAIGEERGIAIGEERGIAIGQERGIAIGEERGIAIGQERGIDIGMAKILLKLYNSGNIVEQLSGMFDMPEEEVKRLLAIKC